jgi:hypothetical protein
MPLAKKLTLLNTDGSPSELYKKFRNPSTSRAAMAEAIKAGYRELFERNEYANNLNKDQMKGLIVEITGLDAGNRIVALVGQTFNTLKGLADFDEQLPKDEPGDEDGQPDDEGGGEEEEGGGRRRDIGLNLAYTINLVLPKTDDPAVFNAIFKSLRDNLLRK